MLERQLTTDTGSKLDLYEMEVAGEKADVLTDLFEFQLASSLYNAMLENNCRCGCGRVCGALPFLGACIRCRR